MRETGLTPILDEHTGALYFQESTLSILGGVASMLQTSNPTDFSTPLSTSRTPKRTTTGCISERSSKSFAMIADSPVALLPNLSFAGSKPTHGIFPGEKTGIPTGSGFPK
ncbi:MAG: hypothetical protein MZV63_63375 [Marinilabiliales bacterium]|nr:hypothetical protein [Marinilabiliales bacterium]